MDQLLKKLGIDFGSLTLAYRLGRDAGRKFLRGALIFPGIRISDLQRIAKSQKRDAQILIDKRDHMIESTLDFLEELANLS